MNYQIKPISELREWSKNPRSISKGGYARLKKQIQTLKLFKPFIITPNGEVLGGNMRLKAVRELGITEVPVSIVEPKTEEVAYALADNDRAGVYDSDLLANLTGEFPDFNWADYSIDLKEPTNLQDLLDQFKEVVEDEVPDVSNEPAISKLGEVYQLGRHRLMCGDATKIEDVEKLMNGAKADMVFTDPPYGVEYEGKTKDKLTIENDGGNEMDSLWLLSFENMLNSSKDGGVYYCFSAQGDKMIGIMSALDDAGYFIKQQIVWRKNTIVMGHFDYQFQHEPIFYGWKKGTSHKFYGDRTQSSIWDFDKPSSSTQHPTMKPVSLISKAVKNSSKEDDIVLDLFGGSGSTLIACEQTNRTCYMMEIDPKYCDVIRKRYAKLIDKEDIWQTETPLVDQP